ncbi:hypothetical protein PIB30_078483 [Stylosanthes scabra]|uniref:Uncharacterized protein n=1 Tax=Stylosanthes scabra TaxID=79078 RepID=A0ABU6YPT1_9FABA|nr:hypothetical protein [Stylosanthes scabra]
MATFNTAMVAMQLHSDQRWDTFQQKFDEVQAENRRSFSAINERMDRMDGQLNFLCNTNQMMNQDQFFLYQTIGNMMQEMQQQGIPVTMDNLKNHKIRAEEMQQERMRYQKVLDEVAAERARKQSVGKARRVEEDSEEDED